MKRTIWGNLDWITVFAWLLLILIGLTAIYSATHGLATDTIKVQMRENFDKQVIWLCVSLIMFMIITSVPAPAYIHFALALFVLGFVLVLATLVFGKKINGARAWFITPLGSMQPAEFAKTTTALAVAYFMSKRSTLANFDTYHVGMAIGTILVMGLVIIGGQNDTGTGLIFIAMIPSILFWGNLAMPYMFLMIVPVIAGYVSIANPGGWQIPFNALDTQFNIPVAAILFTLIAFTAMHFIGRKLSLSLITAAVAISVTLLSMVALDKVLLPHQVARIAAFAEPEKYAAKEGYQVLQSTVAIGSGGFFGKGFQKGTQTQLSYVPEQSTDFIFCVIGEEFGFIGSFLVLLLFGIIIVRLILGMKKLTHPFGQIYLACVVSILLTQILINMSMTMGSFPVVGIPLPYLSYGGSALLANTILIGLALNFMMRSHEFPAHRLG